MPGWNWELPHWPQFTFDPDQIAHKDKQFLMGIGSSLAYLKTIEEKDYKHFIVEILSMEGLESSRIEGEILDRESLQSSIKHHFGIQTPLKRGSDKETAMASMLCNVYETFDKPLTHEMLWKWHQMLFEGSTRIMESGGYRTHPEPMQIVSNRYDSPIVFFEAPPSYKVFDEMTKFINWFNSTAGSGSILCRAAIAHIYFESIHPFEDGNGRIGRVLIEKVLSQGIGRPVLIAISKMLEKRKKEYYSALEKCNRTLDVHHWVEFFSSIILQAHEESLELLFFLIEKSKLLNAFSGQINPRQTKVLLRMFEEGPNGFKGGLSAENYIAITKATRPTATRDLTDLVEKGVLLKIGELRHTRYYLNFKRSK
ncbi:MAG: Fic family protein [Parachlamydiales bacterium]|nr:Fic family protein [Verrucomicrobiota bacterium]MBX3719567.1 Fic family protein [Candidatus Acheromyda pituitae]